MILFNSIALLCQMTDSRGKGRTRWASVASTDRTSYTVEELDHNKEYKFRFVNWIPHK